MTSNGNIPWISFFKTGDKPDNGPKIYGDAQLHSFLMGGMPVTKLDNDHGIGNKGDGYITSNEFYTALLLNSARPNQPNSEVEAFLKIYDQIFGKEGAQVSALDTDGDDEVSWVELNNAMGKAGYQVGIGIDPPKGTVG